MPDVHMPIMPGKRCARSHVTTQGASWHTTGTGRASHAAVPPVHVIIGGYLLPLRVLMTLYTITRYRQPPSGPLQRGNVYTIALAKSRVLCDDGCMQLEACGVQAAGTGGRRRQH